MGFRDTLHAALLDTRIFFAASVVTSLKLWILAVFSTLDNLSGYLVLPARSDTRLCLMGPPIFISRGFRGGRQADV